MSNSLSTDSDLNIGKEKRRRIQPIRKAKSTGDVTRGLISFIDNASSSSIEMNDDNHQNTMAISQSTARDAESWSSTSPPHAPAPAPVVVDLPSMNTVNPLAKMLQKQKEIRRQQERLQREEQRLQREEQLLKEDIEKYLSDLSKTCYIDISINRVMCNERVLIKLFDELAPMTCDAFRAICSNRHGFSYENSKFNYLLPHKFIKGGQIIVYSPDGVRLPDRTGPKEKSTIIHDRKGLISINPERSLNEFTITLGPCPMLNHDYVVIGEVITGMNIFESANLHGIRGMADAANGGAPVDYLNIYSCGEM